MHLEDLKRWHWIVIGLLLGLVIAGTRIMWGPSFDQDHDRELQGQLEKELLFPPIDLTKPAPDPGKKRDWRQDHPFFQNLVIHPPLRDEPEKGYWVTGTYIYPHPESRDGHWVPAWRLPNFMYPVSVPYLPKPNYLIDALPWELSDLKPNPNYDESKTAIYSEMGQLENDLKKVIKSEGALRGKEDKDHRAAVDGAIPGASGTVAPAPNPQDVMTPEMMALKQEEAAIRAKLATGPTVKYYFDQLQAKYPTAGFTYRFAWEEVPWVNLVGWTLGMVVLVGGIWPTLVNVLARAGLARPPREERMIKLSDGKSQPTAAKPVGELTADDLERMRALEAELAQNIVAGGIAPATTAPPKVVELTAAPVADEQPKTSDKPREIKSFGATGGDFYPTEVHAGPTKKA